MSVNILGVKVDDVTLDQATDKVSQWVKKGGKYVVTTPNVEFIILAQKNDTFRSTLNQSDLAIPDSHRLKWAQNIIREKNPVFKILKWPLFIFPKVFGDFPATTGVDLMENLCSIGEEKGFRIGLLGGREGVAEKTRKCLLKRFPKLKISFAQSGGRVNKSGEMENEKPNLPASDIVFVALGQVKQELWINNYKDQINSRVFIGVGGAFDYISGEIKRAPQLWRILGFEWLYRVIKQPWRLKRFGSLVKFIFLVPFS